jgi:fructosamine-3-kinase
MVSPAMLFYFYYRYIPSMQAVFHELVQQLSAVLARPVTLQQARQVTGGDISQAYCLDTNAGLFFVKLNRDCPADFFEREAAGLQLLAAARHGLQVPQVMMHGHTAGWYFLVLHWLQKEKPGSGFWQHFAQELAALHRCTATAFGLATDNYIGRLPQYNSIHNSWAAFYAAQRILPLAQQALQTGLCSPADMQAAERLCGKLNHYFPEEAPALLHGDLWSGNYSCTTGNRAAIFDPAVYYGHREMDLAMSLLFGGFDSSFYTFYHEAYPLEHQWQDRVPLCQLYPLLVHLLLFGRTYYPDVKAILHRYA